jgi:hypothetical protein
MARTMLACLVPMALTFVARADDHNRTIVALEVRPMAAPNPALRYPLLPELRTINPGNPILGYLKCFGEQTVFFNHVTYTENRAKWLTMPLHDLPLSEMHGYNATNPPMRQADHAARLDTPDWQALLRMKSEGLNMPLPELQQMRTLVDVLLVRWRAQLAARRIDDAVRTAQTTFALSRHLSEYPCAIADFVAVAVARRGLEELEEMIQQPDCPNFYWSLTDLPSPFIDIRRGLQGERTLTAAEFATFDTTAPMGAAQLKQALKRLDTIFEYRAIGGGKPADGTPPPPEAKPAHELVEAWAADREHVAAARKRLVASGLAEDVVEKLPELQIVLLDERREYETRQDDVMKLRGVPFWKAETILLALPGSGEDQWLFDRLGTGINLMRVAVQLEQRIALLRHVEALRLYAAEHGKLPGRLADVTVPLPGDPVTGQAFAYEVDGAKATLRTRLAYRPNQPEHGLQYEVTLRR